MSGASRFTFESYTIDASRSTVHFFYRVEFEDGNVRTFTDRLILPDVPAEAWVKVAPHAIEPTLQALLIMLGINYWCVFRTKNIRIEGFSLTREQAAFWDTLYLNGLAEFFSDMQVDFRGLVAFPFDESAVAPNPVGMRAPQRSLLLNGAGKDSILSAEILKERGSAFDFFAFDPTPAHTRIARSVGAKTVRAIRRRDLRLNALTTFRGVSGAYPSVSTFTFVATLLAQLLGYDSIVLSNERSADFGNFEYLGFPVNHQWCKSSAAERMIEEYIHRHIAVDISTRSLLREYSEIEIVRRFVQYPQYLRSVTSCNNYFWLPRPIQLVTRKSFWCKECPKCVFLFACFAAYLPKEAVVGMFGADLFQKPKLLPLFKSILGIEGTKPLDCVGEPEEMIEAMRRVVERGEYDGESAIVLFKHYFREASSEDGPVSRRYRPEEPVSIF